MGTLSWRFSLAQAIEKLGRASDAVYAAKLQLEHFPFNVALRANAHAVVGRCLAALGRMDEAVAIFRTGVAEANTHGIYFLEMLLNRDLITHVLDQSNRRHEQMAALGRQVCRPLFSFPAPLAARDGLAPFIPIG